jgi:hypothetical protein
MVRKLEELPMFLVFNSRTNSLGNISIFFNYCYSLLYRFQYFLDELLIQGLVTFCYVCLSDGVE